MICQIYSALSTKEALNLIDAGTDYIGIYPIDDPHYNGVYPGDSTVGSTVDYDTARAIIDAVGDNATVVALSLSNDEDEIFDMALKLCPPVLHVSGPHFKADRAFREKLRTLLPNTRLMHVVAVTDLEHMDEAVNEALRLQDVADILILDTGAPQAIGAVGKAHDWNVSKRIVEVSKVPVILAGGLSPDNVAEAVAFVRPWGVDSFNKTNRKLPDGRLEKDLDKVRAFCREAKKAEG